MRAAKQFVEQKLGFCLVDRPKQFDFPSFEWIRSWEYPHEGSEDGMVFLHIFGGVGGMLGMAMGVSCTP